MNLKDSVVSVGRRRIGVALLIAVAPILGCKGLINVNGKPLGGGSSNNSSGSSGNSGNSSSSGGSSSSGNTHNASLFEDREKSDDGPKASQPQPLTDSEMMVVKPEGMQDAAEHKPGRIPWCPPGAWKGAEVWDKGRLGRSISCRDSYDPGTTCGNGIEQICQWADDPTWQRQATYIVQNVMNYKKVSQDEAVGLIKKYVAANQAERAKEGKEPTDEERFEFSETHLAKEEPDPGVETAKIGAVIPWCDGIKITDRWDPGRISRTIRAQYGISGTIEGALHLCQRPKDASWRLQAGFTLQKWMNWTKQSQNEAIASFKARIQIEKFKSEHDALCKELQVGAEVGGELKAYSTAHRKFFGCNEHDEEQWRAGSSYGDDSLTFYFDADDTLDSEIIRLVWLFSQTQDPTSDKHNPLPSKDPSYNRRLLDYSVASIDYANIDAKALEKQLGKAPFNTTFAKTVVNESVATLKWRRKTYEEAIDKLVKSGGDEYSDILREAPKKGFAEWKKVTAPWKAELDRSRAFEKKLSNPSRKVLAGCAAELMPDAQKLIKGYKKSAYNDLVTEVSNDPIASLLLSRLSVCFAYEKVFGGSGALKDLVQKGRDLRGPRSLAYYAIVDAVVEAMKDRPKLLLNLQSFSFRTSNLVALYNNEFNFSGTVPHNVEDTRDQGYVKDVKKTGDTVEVTFKTQKLTWPELSCRDTNRPARITSDGRIEYQQHCVATGKMRSQDNTPQPVKVHALLATGIAAGVYIVQAGSSDTGVIPFVKKKQDAKKIETFFGFSL